MEAMVSFGKLMDSAVGLFDRLDDPEVRPNPSPGPHRAGVLAVSGGISGRRPVCSEWRGEDHPSICSGAHCGKSRKTGLAGRQFKRRTSMCSHRTRQRRRA